MLRKRMLTKQDDEFLVKEDEKSESDSDESAEYEEYTDSEEETGMFFVYLFKVSYLRNYN